MGERAGEGSGRGVVPGLQDGEDPAVEVGRSETSASLEVLYAALARMAGDISDFERRAAARRAERDGVIRELLRRDETERRVAAVARISGPAVHQIKERD